MRKPSAKTVLAQMMKELHENDWPSDETWADACRVLGRPIPPKLRPGEPIHILDNMVAPKRKFEP